LNLTTRFKNLSLSLNITRAPLSFQPSPTLLFFFLKKKLLLLWLYLGIMKKDTNKKIPFFYNSITSCFLPSKKKITSCFLVCQKKKLLVFHSTINTPNQIRDFWILDPTNNTLFLYCTSKNLPIHFLSLFFFLCLLNFILWPFFFLSFCHSFLFWFGWRTKRFF
jgi:hypothetical protein